MQTVKGISIQSGIAIGRLSVYRRADSRSREKGVLSPTQEWERFQTACRGAWEQLEELYSRSRERLGEETAEIFQVQQMMLEDGDFLDAVRREIWDRGAAAEQGVSRAGAQFAGAFRAMDSDRMRDRAADIEDNCHRIEELLAGRGEGDIPLDSPVILAADGVSPGQLVRLDPSKLLGVVLCSGTADSHAAILARSMGVPVLAGIGLEETWDGRMAVLDGGTGHLYLDPDADMLSRAREQQAGQERERTRLLEQRELPSVTRDGRELQICANICGVREVPAVLAHGAQGVGLFRTEFLFLGRPDWPDEEEQYTAYRQVVEGMAGRKVVLRTLDMGGDKRSDRPAGESWEGSAMGLRGIRLCLAHREIFRTQLRAILRAGAFGPLSVMFPMVTSLWEVQEAKRELEDCRRQLYAEGIAAGCEEIGIMIETPAAALVADELAQEVDFFSLGTNDLTQYTLAMDREDTALAPFFDPRHPAVLRQIRQTVEAGHRHGCWVGICGDLGTDLELTQEFLDMGVDELSVPPAAILPLKMRVRAL